MKKIFYIIQNQKQEECLNVFITKKQVLFNVCIGLVVNEGSEIIESFYGINEIEVQLKVESFMAGRGVVMEKIN